MKKNVIKFLVFAFILSLFTFVGCQPESKEVTYTDGIINVKNDTDQTIYVKLSAINRELSTGDEKYANRVDASNEITLLKGETGTMDYDFSKFRNNKTTTPSVLVSYDKINWIWYYYGSFNLYNQVTSISVVRDADRTFKMNTTYSTYTFTPEEESCKIPVTNSCPYPIWVQFVAWDDNSWNYPKAMSNKVKIEAGATFQLSYPKGFDDRKKSLTVISHDNYWGTYRTGLWTTTAPSSFKISIDGDDYKFEY